jgi:hypothetical protein
MDPTAQILYPDATQRLMNLVQGAFGLRGQLMQEYLLGLPDNVVLPDGAFPCVIVDKLDGDYDIADAPTSTDSVTEEIYIHILVDVKTGFNTPNPEGFVKRQLQILVEGRDQNTGYLLPNTLMYALRTNLTLKTPSLPGVATIDQRIHVSYRNPIRPDMPETRECIVTVTVKERQVVLSRR